jgi:hypothetical protein
MDEDDLAHRSPLFRKSHLVELRVLDVSFLTHVDPGRSVRDGRADSRSLSLSQPSQAERVVHSNAQGVQPGRHPLDLVCV